MPKVLFTPTMFRGRAGEHEEILRRAGLEIVYPPQEADTMRPPVLKENLAGCEAICASTEPLTREVLQQSDLRVVARLGVGYDSVDTAAATELGVAVTITPGAVEESVAEHTIALMLGVTRAVVERDRQVREGHWPRTALPRMAGKTFGVVGLGRIGKTVAPLVRALGMNVIAHDPAADEAFARRHNIRLCSLEELLQTADVVSLHCPCTPHTTDLINADSLKLMKPGAVLINTSRGGLIDEDALCNALQSGHLLGAALDVFKTEPLPLDSPLLQLPNLLLCTHMGGLDKESEIAMATTAAQCVADLYQGRWPERCVVNPEVRERFKWKK